MLFLGFYHIISPRTNQETGIVSWFYGYTELHMPRSASKWLSENLNVVPRAPFLNDPSPLVWLKCCRSSKDVTWVRKASPPCFLSICCVLALWKTLGSQQYTVNPPTEFWPVENKSVNRAISQRTWEPEKSCKEKKAAEEGWRWTAKLLSGCAPKE